MRELLGRFLEELKNVPGDWRTTAADLPTCREILDATPEQQAALLRLIAEENESLLRNRGREGIKTIVSDLTGQMLRRKLPFTEGDLIRIANRIDAGYSSLPAAPTVGAIEAYVAEHELSDALREALTALHKRLMPYSHSTEDRRVLARLELLLGTAANAPLFAASDAWTVAAKAEILAMEPARQAAWRELLALARSAPAKPSKKWWKDARARIDRVGADSFRDAMRRWLPLFDQPEDRDLPDAPNLDVLRGLVFATILVADPSLPPLLGAAAERAYRKIPGIGVMAAKIGNACVVALGELGTSEAAAQLSRLRSRVKVRSAAKVIDREFAAAAERAGLTPEHLEESTVSTPEASRPRRRRE